MLYWFMFVTGMSVLPRVGWRRPRRQVGNFSQM